MKQLILNGVELSEFLDSIRTVVREEISLQDSVKKEWDLNEMIDIDAAAKFLKKAKQTIYGYCSKNTIPHYNRGGKNYFKVAELQKWIESGKQKTIEEIQAEADNISYTIKNKSKK